MALGLALTVGLAAALMAVRMAQEADQSRLEAEAALARVNLDGQHNELLLLLSGELREALRGLIAGGSGRFAFGDGGGEAPSQSSVARDMEGLRLQMQAVADGLLCSRGMRLMTQD
ncbi:hypothetical protein DV704_09820 [Meiothermus sp. QL-1]|nr:hypothetical protein DV704_09820 [Meiothermus sp. QL-1]